MLTLAAMYYAAFMFVGTQMNMLHKVPPPVIIETGQNYNYSSIESAIYVPEKWTDDCDNQQLLVTYMTLHFNNYRNGKQKFSYAKLDEIASKWRCIE